ncbi:MAG: tRNA epoxyqueuosine(34) reductase QueG [Rhodocyclaceae bacterium]|nr:tRNA epoxyqueuosine(34) reductase QueG [Rhodocyclaceae bacterium]
MHDQNSIGDFATLRAKIHQLAEKLGFAAIGVARADPGAACEQLREWLAAGYHGSMDYMARHAELRCNPSSLHPGTLSVISVAVDYLPHQKNSDGPEQAAISRYAQGRDYHKLIRNRLQKLADEMTALIGPFGYRVFSDSAPVMEVHFASQAGLGWRGKHTLLLSKQGSWRFLGEIYCDLPLPVDSPTEDHCGTCKACIDACPTKAIIAPYQVDARRCISYLTIELAEAIPEEFRPLIGNRIYGCDDCQLCCPWNRFAQLGDSEFRPRQGLDEAPLTGLFAWTEEEFNERLAGNPIRRIGHERWLRNIAVALGNATPDPGNLAALESRLEHPSALVHEHIVWAITQQREKLGFFGPLNASSGQ